MNSTSQYILPAAKWIIRKPHWGAWVYASLMLSVEWSVRHSILQALNVFAANFLLYHLLGKNGIIIAFVSIWNIGENFYDGKPIRILDFSAVLLVWGIAGVFASLLGAALLIGYANDKFFKPQNKRIEDTSLCALGWTLLIPGLIAAFVGFNAYPYK